MNFDNRTLFIADNLDIMRGMDSDTIDLIYLDPPFKSGKQWKAPIGSPAEGAEFKDIWTDKDIKDEWHGHIAAEHEELYQIIQASETVYDKSMKIYLTAMAVRLFEMHRILKPTGSIYLHCDPTASHYLKAVMDDIFGVAFFRNEIIWQRIQGAGKSTQYKAVSYGTATDQILYYAYPESKFDIDSDLVPFSEDYTKKFKYKDEKGLYTRRNPFRPPGLGERPNLCYEYKGFYPPNPSGWTVSLETLKNLDEEGELEFANGKVYRKHRLKAGKRANNLWLDIPPALGNEKTGYPTQKPLALLNRIIKASSDEGDMVLDPFCGCATACVAAERLHRHWVGIDISPSAEDITKLRLTEQVDEASDLFNPLTDVIIHKDAPERTDNAEERAVQMRLPAYQTHKPELFGRQEGKCNGCQISFHFRNLTVDHKRPQSKDGTDHIENLQLLCQACNSTKGAGTQEELIARLTEQGVLK